MNYLKQLIPSVVNQKENLITIDMFHQLLQLMEEHKFSQKEISQVDNALKSFFPTQSKSTFMNPLKKTSNGKVINFKQTMEQVLSIENNGLLANIQSVSKNAAEVMEDLGYSVLSCKSNFKEVLSFCLPLKEHEIALMVGMMARTHTGQQENFQLYSFDESSKWDSKTSAKTWNINVFVETISELYKNIDWNLVIANLDNPNFQLLDQKGFNFIISLFKKATKNSPFPVNILFSLWSNTGAQFSIIKFAVNSYPDFFSFCPPPPNSFLEGCPNTISAASGTPDQNWFSLELVEILLELSEVENYSLIRALFDHPIKSCPEILFMTITQAKVFFFFFK